MDLIELNNSVSKPNFFEEKSFYGNGEKYWSEIPATVDGMLGGYGFMSYCDIQGSEAFLKKLLQLKNKPSLTSALDCGAGIGRITKNLLVKYFKKVDLVEQNAVFLEEAKKMFLNDPKIRSFYNSGLQNFKFEKKYDVIWCQWVLGHLTDLDLINFLKCCQQQLCENGIIVIKENVSNETIVKDENDSSVTRPLYSFKKIFEKAGLKVIRECKQTNFPQRLFPVRMFALRPFINDLTPISSGTTDTKVSIDLMTDFQNLKLTKLKET